MKKLMVVIAFLVVSNISNSQWIYQNNIDSITTISSGSFINSNTGWYARSKGQISKTTDGGLNWSTITISTNDLNSIEFTSSNTGYVCGNNGCIMKSVNGGLNWSIQNPSSNDTLVSLDFVNDLTGWCAGRDFIMFTSNGGSQWYRQNLDTSTLKPRFTYLKMYDSQNGLAGAFRKNTNDMYAYIYKTSNGGVNWNFVDSVNGYRISSICYINQNILFISNYQFLYKSTNGGNNWQLVSIPFNQGKSKVHFISENTGWYTSMSNLYKTTNGGNNWTTNISYSTGTFCEFNYTTNENIYSATLKGSVYKTTNNGINWGNYSVNIESDLYGISIIDANTIFTGGSFGDLWKSTNGGINWQNKFRDGAGSISSPYFVNSNTGFLISGGRFLYKSTNAGESWLIVGSVFQRNINSMLCIDENNIWVVGDSGLTLKTTNSGNNWINKSINDSLNIYRIISNGNSIYLTVFKFTFENEYGLYKSTNSGDNWIKMQFDSTNMLGYNNIRFLNSQIGWMFFSENTRFYKTSDGGNTWIKHYRNDLNLPIGNFCFVNENTGYANTFSYYNGLIKTTNSGLNWFTVENFPYYNNYFTTNVSFLNENTGWVVGQSGLILKTTNAGSTFVTFNNQNVPSKFSLTQNYPNPFNPTTKISYKVKSYNVIKLCVYDILGKEVTTLVNEKQNAGTYEVTFDGSGLTSGIYFYKLTCGDFSETKKMLMIK